MRLLSHGPRAGLFTLLLAAACSSPAGLVTDPPPPQPPAPPTEVIVPASGFTASPAPPNPRYTVQSGRPFTIAFEGQSNMQGQGDSVLSIDLSMAQAREFIYSPQQASGYLRRGLSDPMSRNLITSNRSSSGSLIPSFVAGVGAVRHRQVLACMTAVQGSHLFVQPGESPAETWRPGMSYLTMADRKIAAMLAEPECPDGLDLVVTMLGETDFTNVMRYPTSYKLFPDSMVVTPADSIPAPGGGYLTFPAPRGYPNPRRVEDIYTNFCTYYKNRMDRWGAPLLVIGTGLMLCNTAAHEDGGRMAGPMQRFIVNRLRAEGYRIGFVRGAEKLPASGYQKPCPDGVHYTQQGYNLLGEWAARKALQLLR